MPRTLRTLAEFIAAFVALVLLVMAVIIWRLSSSPMNSSFLTPYVESGIESYIPDGHVQIAHTLLTWDNIEHTINLHADGLVIKDGSDGTIAEVPKLDISLSVIGIAVGQFWPTQMLIDQPQITLDRHADGRLYFAAMTTQGTSSGQSNSREALKKAMSKLTRAYAMHRLAIDHAVINVHDDVTNSDWSMHIPEISLQRSFTQLTGAAKIDLTQKDKPASLELRYAYDRLKGLHRVSTRFQDITPSQLANGHPETLGFGAASIFDVPLSGETELAFNADLAIAEAAVTLHGGAGVLHDADLWDKARPIKNFDIEGDFDAAAYKLNIVTAVFNFDGPKLSLTAASHKPADPKKYDLDFTLNARIENWPMDAFHDLWPKPVITNAREWMEENLAKGSYDKGEGTFEGSLNWNDLANINVATGHGKVVATRGNVTYIKGMPPVENVNAEGEFDLQQMTVTISQGGIGNLHIVPFAMTITGLADTDQYITIPLKVAGPIIDVVKLIDHEPLRYAHAVGLPPDILTGMAQGTVTMHFPLLKALETKDIDVTAEAQLSNVASTQFVKGLELSQGELGLTLDKEGLAVKGPLQINKIPVQLAMQEYFHEAKDHPLRSVDLTGTIQDGQWGAFGDVFTGTHGSATAALHLTQPTKAETIFTGNVDFTGAALHVQPLNWHKPPGAPADAQFNGTIVEGKDITIQSISLHGPQAEAQGKAVFATDGTLKSAELALLNVGRSSANISFLPQPDTGILRLDARGKSLDISGLTSGGDKAKADPQKSDTRSKEFHIKLDTLYTSDTGHIDKVEGYGIRDSLGWSAIKLHGLADGEHKLDINLTPQPDGSRKFAIICDDFGKMLKGLGFTDTVKEGDVKIIGASSKDDPRAIEGTVKIGGFSVGNLPVLAVLLNATTPFGFAGIVTNSASFNSMSGGFRWSGDEVELKHINVPGLSVGINVEGKVNTDTNRANLNGTIVPFSIVNRVLGSIPVIGDILTGGNGGGVLAVAYTIKGALANPDVNVNPVSLLTPGFLRNLFFGAEEDDESLEPPVSDAETDTPTAN